MVWLINGSRVAGMEEAPENGKESSHLHMSVERVMKYI
jgi:hypothetical protein